MITPSGRKVTQAERREKKERDKNAVNSGHLVPLQHTQATWTKIVLYIKPTRCYCFLTLEFASCERSSQSLYCLKLDAVYDTLQLPR